MKEFQTQTKLLKHAGKLDKIKILSQIIGMAPRYAPQDIYKFFDEQVQLFQEYTEFDSNPPQQISDYVVSAMLCVFSHIRNTSDIASFDRYEPVFQEISGIFSKPTETARVYQVFGYMYWLKNSMEMSIHYLSESLNILKTNNITDDFPERYTNLGFVYEYMGDLNKAEKLYREGLKFAKKHNFEEALISAYSGMGRLNLQQKKFQNAVEYLEKNLALVANKGFNRESATIQVNLAIAYLNLKQYDKALDLNLQLDNKILEENDKELYFTVMLNTGVCYSDRGDYVQALPYFKKANAYARETGDIPQLIFSLINLGRISKFLNDLLGAKQYLEEALTYLDSSNNQAQYTSVLMLLGELEFSKQNYSEALQHFDTVYKYINSSADLSAKQSVSKYIALCHKNQGNHQQACIYLEQCMSLSEEIFLNRDEPDEEIKQTKTMNSGKRTHYLFSDSISLLSRELNTTIGSWLVGISKEIQEVVEKAYIAAKNENVNVMIYGESGTGKELIAKLIHHSSSRANAPFVEINSAVFTTGLAESSLFGHKKGSFTGANENHIGFFQSADKGTLFLDEISEMPAEIQSMMLRVLETKKIRPLGSNSDIKVDFRLISASNRQINKLVESKNFRFDLFNRINTMEITLPPLRQRKDDIPLLINYFLSSLADEMSIKAPKLSAKTMDILCDYHYPGNVRELKNIIHRLLLFKKRDVIESEDLPSEYLMGSKPLLEIANLNIEEHERFLISEAMKRSNNIVSNAAVLLGISPFALARRLKKYGKIER